MANSSRYSSQISILLFSLLLSTLIPLISAQDTFQGCYAVDTTLVLNDTNTFQSTGRCGTTICGAKGYAVFGLTSGSQCWCGNSLPSTQVDTGKCTITCPGWKPDTCGGVGYLSVFLTGMGTLEGSAATQILSSTTPSATQTKGAPSNTVYVTSGQTTIIQSATSDTSTASAGGVSGGAAAGIAIGVLALVALGVGAFFLVRRRRRAEYQRQYEGSGFGSSPGSLNRPFGTDQRLEPQMLQKRESVGSLADEHDYSRKILRVTNPDGT